jgi:hypothetical protein
MAMRAGPACPRPRARAHLHLEEHAQQVRAVAHASAKLAHASTRDRSPDLAAREVRDGGVDLRAVEPQFAITLRAAAISASETRPSDLATCP